MLYIYNILYINDLSKYLYKSKVSLYADDTALYLQARTQVEIMLDLRIELSLIYEWLKANKLTLNADKTKYIVFGTNRQLTHKNDLNLKVGNKKIERVSSMKYLGIILDENLSFTEHIKYIFNKSTKKLGILRRAREYLDQKTSILLFKSLIVPYLDYCDTVYMCGSSVDLKQLQLIQNSACQIILKVPKETGITTMHDELKLMQLSERREYHLLVECHNNVHNEEASLNYMFVKTGDVCTRVTRNTESHAMVVLDIRSVIGRKAFSFRGLARWNSLDRELRQISSKNGFKNRLLKEFLRDVNHPG